MTIRVLIADDEPLARERIRDLLGGESDVELAGESGDGETAVRDILRLKPDVLFLDIQMPGLDGFGVLEAVADEHLPCTVMVTAYDRYAVRAFEANAMDYLLKPFCRDRFQETMRRVRARVAEGGNGMDRQLQALLEAVHRPRTVDRLVVKHAGRVFFVRTSDIDYLQAAGNYVRLHVGKDEHLVRETMNSLESKLDQERFARIHRSTIVNIERIKELQPAFHGDYVVILRTGAHLTLSRGYRARVEQRLGTSL